MSRLKHFFVRIPAFFLFLALTHCQQSDSSNTFANCKSGTPSPIFNKDLEGIAKHQFKLEKSRAIETLEYQSGESMSIIQTGCDYIKQDFQFHLLNDPKTQETTYWVDLAIKKLIAMSAWEERYQVFGFWAQAIRAKREEIKLAESIELQPGAYATIDRISGGGNAILMLTLSEKP